MKTGALAAVLFVLCGCAAQPPYRTLEEVSADRCRAVFRAADVSYAAGWKAAKARIEQDLAKPESAACWRNSQELHDKFDLYTVEFDDQGWLAVPHEHRKPPNAMTRLAQALRNYSSRGQSLTIVVYTHGWHHSAYTADRDVIAFRYLLERLAILEEYLCEKRGKDLGVQSCHEANQSQPWQTKRRVVGVYAGWRGDSLKGPLIEALSVWDRKLAAEQVAYGAIQELFARLHGYYVRHGCHSAQSDPSCLERPDVRMLTIGHSFGGLITYRALAPALMSTVIEKAAFKEGTAPPYVHSYGDLTILINPAFEATRLETLARAAVERQYNIGTHPPATAQLPILVIAQSSGDTATEWAFPAFRRVTTLFEGMKDDQYLPNVTAAGWSDRYKTHDVSLGARLDLCPGWKEARNFRERVDAEAAHMEAIRKSLYKPLHGDFDLCGGLTIRRYAPGGTAFPFTPVWSLRLDAKIAEDHNDFLNPNLQQLFRQIFFAHLREQDEYYTSLVRRTANACDDKRGSDRLCQAMTPLRRAQ